MRYSFLTIFMISILAMLSGCDTDSSTTDLEQNMFLENPPPDNYVISSPLKGFLLKGGKPFSHAKIIRKLRWNGNEDGVFQEFVTDESGAFALPVHEETLSFAALAQFVGKTNIYVVHDGVQELFWFSTKKHKDLNSEFDMPPEELICDISTPDMRVNIKSGMCMTRCRWSNMPKEYDPNEL